MLTGAKNPGTSPGTHAGRKAKNTSEKLGGTNLHPWKGGPGLARAAQRAARPAAAVHVALEGWRTGCCFQDLSVGHYVAVEKKK